MIPKEAKNRLADSVHNCLTAELTTIREGFPITFPVVAFFDESKESIITSTAPAFSQKVDNIEANPKVSILFNASDTVLVKGDGKIHDEDFEENALYGMRLITEEPETPKKSAYMKMVERLDTWYGKLLLDWYAIRIIIEIEPKKLYVWDGGDMSSPPFVWEVGE